MDDTRLPLGKVCSRCGAYKLLAEFSRQKIGRYGRQPKCKACEKEFNAAYYQKHCEKLRTQNREWRQRNALREKPNPLSKRCKDCKQIKQSDQFHKDKGALDGLNDRCKDCNNQQHALWYEKNVERARTRNNRYARRKYHENPSSANQRVKAREKWKQQGPCTGEQLRALTDFYDGKCLCCGRMADTYDHVVSYSVGGLHEIENVQLLCRSCNSSKQTKTTDYRDPYLHAAFMEALVAEGLA